MSWAACSIGARCQQTEPLRVRRLPLAFVLNHLPYREISRRLAVKEAEVPHGSFALLAVAADPDNRQEPPWPETAVNVSGFRHRVTGHRLKNPL